MSYRVIKRIKGHSYLYEQSTFRVGGKVKTQSRYIGPVDDVVATISNSTNPIETTMETVREELTLQINPDTKQETTEQSKPPEPPQEGVLLHKGTKRDIGFPLSFDTVTFFGTFVTPKFPFLLM